MAIVASSSNYCSYCGNRLQAAKTELKICARCGGRIPASAKFCPNCGEDVGNPKLKMRLRFAWLKDLEKSYASDYTRFRAAGIASAEDEKEEPVFDKAKKKVKDTNEPVMIYVILFEKRGEIDSFPWALIRPDGTIEYIYSQTEKPLVTAHL
jgi:ribosomal protein L40E